jgi:hypothetical protein
MCEDVQEFGTQAGTQDVANLLQVSPPLREAHERLAPDEPTGKAQSWKPRVLA